MLRTAKVVEDHSGADEVGMDTKVLLYYEDEDETEEVKIVTSIRGNSLEGRISIESPMGKALLGHKVGDRVFVKVGDGGYEVVIRAIDKDGGEDEGIRKF